MVLEEFAIAFDNFRIIEICLVQVMAANRKLLNEPTPPKTDTR
jgi:hypothetical protein